MESAQLNSRILFLVLLSTLTVLPWIGEKPFYSRGEPREAIVVQGMVERGEYVLGRGYGGVVASKPPMMHWIASGVSVLKGAVTEATVRLPSAIFGVGCGALILFLLTSVLSVRERGTAVFLLMTSVAWFRASSTARVDMTLTFFITLGLFVGYRWCCRIVEGKRCWGGYSALVLSLLAAVLTKGPVALVLPVGILVLFLWSEGYGLWRSCVRGGGVAFPVFCFSLLWYLAAYRVGGEPFFDRMYYENVARFTSQMHDKPHAHSLWYLYGQFVIGWMPWSLCAIPIGIARWRGLFHGWRLRYRSASSLTRFSVIVVVAVLLFYSIPSSKRGVYLLPAYPFASILMAKIAFGLGELERRWVSWTCGGVLILLSFALLGVLSLPWHLPLWDASSHHAVLLRAVMESSWGSGSLIGGALVTLLLLLVAGSWMLFSRVASGGTVVMAGGAFLMTLAVLSAIYLPSAARVITARQTAAIFAPYLAHQQAGTPIYTYKRSFYGLHYYLRRQLTHVTSIPDHGVVMCLVHECPDQELRLKGAREIVTSPYPMRRLRYRVRMYALQNGVLE